MTCNVVWLRQALAEYQNRLNNVLCVTAAEIPALEYRRANGGYLPKAQFMASTGRNTSLSTTGRGSLKKKPRKRCMTACVGCLHKHKVERREKDGN